jgi:hypothetical protein
MVDLFFYRDPDETEKEEETEAPLEEAPSTEWDQNWDLSQPTNWGDTAVPVAAAPAAESGGQWDPNLSNAASAWQQKP